MSHIHITKDRKHRCWHIGTSCMEMGTATILQE